MVVVVPMWLKPPKPGLANVLGETKAFSQASSAHMKRQILALPVVHGRCVSAGIVLLLKLS